VTNTTTDVRQLAADLAEELLPLLRDQPSYPGPLLDADQAAELLSVPASWVRAEARAGRIPNLQLGHYRRFERQALLDWLDHRRQGPRSRMTTGNRPGGTTT